MTAGGLGGLGELVGRRSVVVCCGSGGVGKTTVAASIALQAAREGRRCCVVTIDPAKRLADALGLESLTNTPGLVEGDWPGELWALMLDTKGTFDDLVGRYATEPSQAESIRTNRIYGNLSSALSGTQEYMASEKLYELHEEGRFDLVVVDTPPTRDALDFIDAPRRLTGFLDNRVFRMMMAPTRALRAVSVATRSILRTISKVVGSEVVSDAVDFFQAFEGMEEGFRERAGRVVDLLSDEGSAFVLVASPRRDAVAEALYFADRLAEAHIAVQALVVNRLLPRFEEPAAGAGSGAGAAGSGVGAAGSGVGAAGSGVGAAGFGAGAAGSGAGIVAGGRAPVDPPAGRRGADLAVLEANLAALRSVAEREEANYSVLAERVAPAPVARVPFLRSDVHDLSGLAEVAGHLFPPPGQP
ncbi:MAG: ArsA family ATPase [Acidimicrobiales bacterium]